jgi:cell division septation protein DedD
MTAETAPAAPAASVAEPAAPAAPAAATPAPAKEVAVTSPAAPATSKPAQATAGGGWKIQLASVKSDALARQQWGRLQKAHSDLLGDMRLTVQQADLGTKGTYYRIQAGPLPDRTTAEDVCAELKSAKQPCIVVKP